MTVSDIRASVRRRSARFVVGALVAATVGAAAAPATPATAAVPTTGAFVALGPVRLADTRLQPCGCERVDALTITVDVAARSDVPDDVIAVAIVVTSPTTDTPGFVTAYPSGVARPLASTLNTRADRAVANTAIVPVGTDGRIALFTSVPGDVLVDLTGAFVASGATAAGRFVPVTSRRIADTRDGQPVAGPVTPNGDVTIGLPAEVPGDARAVAVTITSVGDGSPGFWSARPAGATPTTTSFLNVNGSGQPVAATAILPVSADGVTLRPLHRGHVLVDLLGWFTGASAPVATDGLFVPATPQRLLDTRASKPRAWPGGTVELPVSVAGAGALVTNVTVTAADRAGFVTAYPAGTPRPEISTLNPAMLDHTLANLAITRVSSRGLAYYAHAGADVVVDMTGWFVGSPIAASTSPAPNAPARSRVLMVGDSTLSTLPLYTASQRAFADFDTYIDVDNCRRLVRPSCRSNVTGRIPNTILEAIQASPGPFDVVLVRAGYNDWNSDFPSEFDTIVRAARAKGAHTILWMSYTSEWSPSQNALRAYQENNADLYRLVTLPQYADVVLADLDAYTRTAPDDWTWDGAHLTEYGTWLTTDYIARLMAAIEHRPCPKPWGPGGPVYDPCPKPEFVGAVPNVVALY
jgi:hypothetical protein